MNHTRLNRKMKKLNIGKIKSIFCFLLMLLCAFDMTMRAEDKEDQKKKIMEIKLNDDFIFGEGISDNKDIAYGLAMDDLLIFANELKGRNSQEKLSSSDLVTKVETLTYENGSRIEVIVYIPVQIVLGINHKQPDTKGGVVLTQPEIPNPQATEEPKMEETKGVEPKIEEIISEEATIEVPTIAEQILEEPIIEEAILVEPILEEGTLEKPTIEEPIIEEATLEEPEVEEVKIENLKNEVPQEEPAQLSTFEEIIPAVTEKKPMPLNVTSSSEVEEFLMAQDNFTEIKKFLSEMKQSGKIVETGVVPSSEEAPKDASLILMDEYGGILALLSPEDITGRINYKTHKTDSENNYNSKFILWYKK